MHTKVTNPMPYGIIAFVVLAVLVLAVMTAIGCSDNNRSGGRSEISHSETDKAGWFGGRVHAANTVYRNDDGSTSIETEKTTTRGDVTTIVRERKTTNLDGTIKVDSETRKIVKGSESVERDSKSSR